MVDTRMKMPLWRIFFRALFIQGSFNTWRMQNLGLIYALIPLLRKQSQDEEKIESFINRHLQRFNTHPYLATAIIGSLVKLETSPGNNLREDVIEFKNALAPPFAAIGDSFFWGAARTFAATMAVVAAFSGSYLAPLVFIFGYGIFHVVVRCLGFYYGYKLGRNGFLFIRSLELPKSTVQLRAVSLLAVSVLSLLVIYSVAGHWGAASIPVFKPGILFLILLFYYWIKWGISPVLLYYLSLAVIFSVYVLWL